MSSRLNRLWTGSTPPRRASRARSANPLRPRLEALEDRVVLSVFPGEIHVNNTIAGNQFDSDNATDITGRSVVVWTSNDAGNDNIRAQRYDSSGSKVGAEILVAGTANSETSPAVAMGNNGNFVVVWTQIVGGNLNIRGERFDPFGVSLGEFDVATTAFAEFDPDVAVATGNIPGPQGTDAFVITYTRTTGAGMEVRGQMRTGLGGFLTDFPVAATASPEHSASVARASGGEFVIAFQTDFGANSDISLQRRNAFGGFLNNLAIANTGLDEENPDVDMDTAGNAQVVWQALVGGNRDIMTRKVSNMGVMGAVFTAENLAANLGNPVVALRANGSFVVAYDAVGLGVRVREFNAASAPVVTTNLGASRFGPAISIVDGGPGIGNYLVTFDKLGALDDLLSGIFGRYGNLA